MIGRPIAWVRRAALLLAAVAGLAPASAQRQDMSSDQLARLQSIFGAPTTSGSQTYDQRQQDNNPAAQAGPAANAQTQPQTTTSTGPVQIEQRERDSGNRTVVVAEPQRAARVATPSEFETYVARVLGRPLPRFGAELLTPAARNFETPATATIPPDYVLGPGDQIAINLTGSIEADLRPTIDTTGRIVLPRVGAVRVAGVRYGDLQAVISQAVGRQFRDFRVTASVAQLRGITVYVVGYANDPGAYTLNSLTTLVNATLAAGGPAAGGSFRAIQVYRRGKLVAMFDFYDFIRSGDRSNDLVLENEDVLYIPPVGPQVAVAGSVNAEAIYESKSGETLADLLRYAGGLGPLADTSRLLLYRVADLTTTGSRELDTTSVRSTAAVGGDILRVLSVGDIARPLERQTVLVKLEGEVAKPGNYYVAPGTTIGQVVEQAGGLTARGFVYGTMLERVSVREQQRIGFEDAIQQLEVSLAAAPLTDSGLQDSSERLAQLASARAVVDRLRQRAPDGRIILDLTATTAALPGDMVLENGDRLYVPPRPGTIGVFGAVYRPGSFQITTPMRVRDYLARAGGPIRVADKGEIFVVHANGAVTSRKSGALNSYVIPGDVVFVPVKTRSYSLLAKIRDISQIVFQLGLGAAAFVAVTK